MPRTTVTLPPKTPSDPGGVGTTVPHRIGNTNFSWDETAVSASHPSLVQPVPAEYRANVQKLADTVQILREFVARPFQVLSWYRPKLLNDAVGGSPTSQHQTASAMDFTVSGQVAGVFKLLLSGTVRIPCGQVIYYPSRNFIHVALPSQKYPSPSFFVSPASKVYKPVRTVTEMIGMGY